MAFSEVIVVMLQFGRDLLYFCCVVTGAVSPRSGRSCVVIVGLVMSYQNANLVPPFGERCVSGFT